MEALPRGARATRASRGSFGHFTIVRLDAFLSYYETRRVVNKDNLAGLSPKLSEMPRCAGS